MFDLSKHGIEALGKGIEESERELRNTVNLFLRLRTLLRRHLGLPEEEEGVLKESV